MLMLLSFAYFSLQPAKKSRCRPAQGQRVKHEGKTRMPATNKANQSKPKQTKPNLQQTEIQKNAAGAQAAQQGMLSRIFTGKN
ncbi:hypothetical protein [Burkholderia sp. Ac-20365]|uniref:hypothetical protein n=1 Tax=Burkholderia sp. Ac-20365 TaxID=2703897 RepID=UPI00197BC7F7|nr:hypothetical protein [Burkholderia sp. Ac-20365]MBN3767654.1 hypothetical protein [Burkholderia sp. Ac-20365]